MYLCENLLWGLTFVTVITVQIIIHAEGFQMKLRGFVRTGMMLNKPLAYSIDHFTNILVILIIVIGFEIFLLKLLHWMNHEMM